MHSITQPEQLFITRVIFSGRPFNYILGIAIEFKIRKNRYSSDLTDRQDLEVQCKHLPLSQVDRHPHL